MSASGRGPRQGGYSLIEVVVAIAIAGTAVAGLVQAIGSNLRHTALTGEYTQATALAESMLTRLGSELPLETGVRDGHFDAKFRWRRAVQARWQEDPLRAADEVTPPVLPYEIAVTVWWNSQSRIRHVTLRTLRLKSSDQPSP